MLTKLVEQVNRQVALGLQAFFLPSIRDTIEMIEEEENMDSMMHDYLVFVEEKVSAKVERNLDLQ